MNTVIDSNANKRAAMKLATPEDAAATPITVTLGGKKYRLHPLRYEELAELIRWMRQELIADAVLAVQRLGDALGVDPVKARIEAIQGATLAAAEIDLHGHVFNRMLFDSAAGRQKLLLLGRCRQLTEDVLARCERREQGEAFSALWLATYPNVKIAEQEQPSDSPTDADSE